MHCPCCSGNLLRHIGQDGLYWYCTRCRQAMPIICQGHSWVMSCPKRDQSDRPTGPKQYWLYIPLEPKHQIESEHHDAA